ncbi:NAD(P)/FAD-dependent oxidoreductase [Shimia sp. MMG029]|uniref:NAD(P)/FAD-dependent oxidoreductase n=1 Tax=Shimia sp. MMG029 TaxID=3021978 RepID=UPI0022FDFA79|nr:FAD-binding oxidoreductase [Shimia sp. MMG029]MDA5556939.1 FAD-binding oxidoreductase [Shimia sp. MMG029]
MTHSKQNIVVVGAGINGAATALWLRRAGCEVTLVDKASPGMGASYGNACLLASCAILPNATPGIATKAPGYLRDPEFPLFMQWAHLPRLLPWLLKFISHSDHTRVRNITQALSHLIGDSVEQHKALAAGTPAERWIQETDYLFAYKDRAAFEKDKYVWDMRADMGFVPDLVEGAAVQEIEPILSSEIRLLAVNKAHGFILNPGSYVQALVDTFTEMGGRFVQTAVHDFEMTGGQVTGVLTDQGRFDCDRAVLSSGIWSKSLARKLGIAVPLEVERGYHVTYRNPSVRTNHPVMIADAKFVATPMDQGLRCAGIVEFGGLSDQKSKAPLALLRRKVAEVFPDLTADSEEEWLGFRPTLPDSLPMVGEIGSSGVYAAFGHQHIGLTGGAKTGRLVADLISGRTPNIDLAPYHPQRFG